MKQTEQDLVGTKPTKWKIVDLVELEFIDEIESQQFNNELDKLCEKHGIKLTHIDQYYHEVNV